MSAEPAAGRHGRIPLLRDALGEPATPLESFARAVGPRELRSLALRLGPDEARSRTPALPPHPAARARALRPEGR